MYKIKHKNIHFRNNLFSTYEQARSFVRKYLREKHPRYLACLYDNHNPPHTKFGFSIVKS